MRTANNPTPADDEAGAAGSAHPEPDLSSRSDRRPTADEKPRLLELSLTQLIGGALAAGTAAVLGSRLGLAGTITGAVVVSLLTATGAAVYTASLRHGRDKIRAAVAGTRIAPRRVRVLAVGAGALAILGTGFAVVTGFELLAGHALSGGGPTTVQQLGPHNGGRPVPSTAPAQPTGTTSVPTTATTKVSPAPTTTVTVTASPTPTPTRTPTPTPALTPTPTPTESAGPSSAAP